MLHPNCTFCGAGPGGWHSWTLGQCWCGSIVGHGHKGVLRPKICGETQVGFLTRLFRRCKITETHYHYRCTACGGKWISPTIIVALLQQKNEQLNIRVRELETNLRFENDLNRNLQAEITALRQLEIELAAIRRKQTEKQAVIENKEASRFERLEVD